ncbi:MAG: DJ-1/PfpI family protein [Tannerellaceae bacterium]|jgi:4-methyl-5(b-hydroxyethyl)-thiazole monophosphate biosynthesis|nr:DJ-1/PfpI family protein [Tannerellaceae bacterium]
MKKAVLFLATGFEETEAVATIDVLRRGDIETTVVSITGDHKVTGAHNIAVTADALFDEMDFSGVDALILPGGMPGSTNLNACEPLKQLLTEHHRDGKLVAAICAAPLVLGGLGILNKRRATCYPGIEPQLIGATIVEDSAVTDGNVITGKGPGLVFNFALSIIIWLKGTKTTAGVAHDLLLID